MNGKAGELGHVMGGGVAGRVGQQATLGSPQQEDVTWEYSDKNVKNVTWT